jgi:hypothetical protein
VKTKELKNAGDKGEWNEYLNLGYVPPADSHEGKAAVPFVKLSVRPVVVKSLCSPWLLDELFFL